MLWGQGVGGSDPLALNVKKCTKLTSDLKRMEELFLLDPLISIQLQGKRKFEVYVSRNSICVAFFTGGKLGVIVFAHARYNFIGFTIIVIKHFKRTFRFYVAQINGLDSFSSGIKRRTTGIQIPINTNGYEVFRLITRVMLRRGYYKI